MIKTLKNTDMKEYGKVYNFMLEDIRMLNDVYPDLAEELAISIIEFIFTDEISSDDYWIKGKIQQYRQLIANQ